jgi:hypothetical protein
VAILSDTRSGLGWRAWVLTLALLLLGAAPMAVAETKESDLKAAFVFNFSQFVEWPTNNFASTNSPFVIGVLGGSNDFVKTLSDLVRNEKNAGHPMTVRASRSVNDLRDCEIVYIGSSEAPRLREIMAHLRDRSVLTVSDMDDFIEQGGIIRLYTSNNKMRMKISLDAAKRSRLTISSKLLRLAEVVGKPNPDR